MVAIREFLPRPIGVDVMHKIPVIRENGKTAETVFIPIADILKIESGRDSGNRHIVHTEKDTYYLNLPWESMEEWLLEDGFILLDANNIVNMNNIGEYENGRGLVYFGPKNAPQTKTATVAYMHKSRVKQLMRNPEKKSSSTSDSSGTEPRISLKRRLNDGIAAEAKTGYLISHDPLTRLMNRQGFQRDLRNGIQAFQEAGGTVACLLLINIDRFKAINSAFGYKGGDSIIREFAKVIQEQVGSAGRVARICGDEFCVLFPGVNQMDSIRDISTELLNTISSHSFMFLSEKTRLTASLGVSVYPNDGTEAETLIRCALIAADAAKKKGGNAYTVYHPALDSQSREQFRLSSDLQHALENDELSLQYQPVYDLKSDRIVGMEALLRWSHHQMGMVPPRSFIPMAEETGLIFALDLWAIHQACRQNKTWLDSNLPALLMSVNVSILQLEHPRFCSNVSQILQSTGLPPHLLSLEFSEFGRISNMAVAADAIARLQKMGVSISLDDFCNSSSSFTTLTKFKADSIKIGKPLIEELEKDPVYTAIPAMVISLCRQLDIRTIAKGVTTENQLRLLKQMGCDDAQGFVISRPLSSADFEIWVREHVDQRNYPIGDNYYSGK